MYWRRRGKKNIGISDTCFINSDGSCLDMLWTRHFWRSWLLTKIEHERQFERTAIGFQIRYYIQRYFSSKFLGFLSHRLGAALLFQHRVQFVRQVSQHVAYVVQHVAGSCGSEKEEKYEIDSQDVGIFATAQRQHQMRKATSSSEANRWGGECT